MGVRYLQQLPDVPEGDLSAFDEPVAGQVVAFEQPVGEVGASASVGRGEANVVVVVCVPCSLLFAGLASVDAEDGSFDGEVVGVDEVDDFVACPDLLFGSGHVIVSL